MPRPRKCRKVCRLPENDLFLPGNHRDAAPITLTVDEFESIRLIDKQQFSQEEAAAYMRVARTTIQAIYRLAREKLAAALVEGRPLIISGGDYTLCDQSEASCGCGGCRRHAEQCLKNKGETL